MEKKINKSIKLSSSFGNIPVFRLAHLWNVDTGPEELQVLPHLLRFELGVEDGELGEHAHVSALQSQRSLQQSDELLKVPAVLIVADQVLQLVGVDHYVKATDLCQTELLTIHTCKTHLRTGGRRSESPSEFC